MKKVLVLCDDLWHPAEVVELGIRGLGDGAYQFDVVRTAKDILTPARLAQYPVVLIAKSNSVNAANSAPWFEDTVTEADPAAFRAYLSQGGGIVFVHSSTCIGTRFLGDADERFLKPAREMQALHGCTMNGHPLRCNCDIHVTDPDRIMETRTAVENIPGIAKARADEAVANGFTTVRNVAGVISIALIAILLLVSVFIISNTIKLTTFDRRDEIAIMKMVGATNGFIRWPFVYEGLLLGLFSAVIAFGLQWGLYADVAQGIANSDSLQILRVVPFTEIWYYVALVFLGAGILVGVGGSLTAIRRFLRV